MRQVILYILMLLFVFGGLWLLGVPLGLVIAYLIGYHLVIYTLAKLSARGK